jgi:N-acetylmuramoyl-L-alanine amidase
MAEIVLDATGLSTLMDFKKRFCFAVVLIGFLSFASLGFSATQTSRQAKAISTFNRALRMRTTLESLPESKRTEAEYKNVIKTFRQVPLLNPSYSKTPVALISVAELYEEMGRLFSTDRYYLEAVKTYQFLIAEYPQNRLSRDALFTLGEIYRTDLESPGEARKIFQQFLEKYPQTAKAEEAQAKIKEIDQKLLVKAATKPAPDHEPAEQGRSGGLSELTAVRHWVGPNYSRIVVGVDGDVKFETSRLANPDRIIVDIENARLSPALLGKTFPVEDGYLHQIRVGQFTPTVARIVLDVEKIEEYSVIPLPNPFRLVVDIRGAIESKQPTEQAAADFTARPAREPQRPEGSSNAATQPTNTAEAAETPEAAIPRAKLKLKPKPEVNDKTETSNETEARTADLTPPSTPPASREQGARSLDSLSADGAQAAPSKAAAPTQSGSRTLTRALGLKIGRIVIDPGHGGHDTGTIGPTGLREKDVVLDVGLRLKKLLEQKAGYEVVMTRSDDTFIPLEERTAVANEKAADLFVSIHANASHDHGARGIETYYLNFTSTPEALEVAARENATSQESVHQLQDLIKKIAMTEKIEESEEFARQVQREVYRRTSQLSGQQRDRGVKKAPFVVLIGANMPSVLAEISFLTNPRDEKSLRRSDYRQKIAEALLQGILDYVNNLGGIRVVQRATSLPPETASKPEADF